jgi:hypothetical protein
VGKRDSSLATEGHIGYKLRNSNMTIGVWKIIKLGMLISVSKQHSKISIQIQTPLFQMGESSDRV